MTTKGGFISCLYQKCVNEEVSIICCLFVNLSWITNTLSGAGYESDEDVHVTDGKDLVGNWVLI